MIVAINPVKKTLPLLCVTCAISFLFFPVDQKKAKMKMVNKVSPMKQELKKFIATGGTIEDARRIMEANGFTCVMQERSDFAEMEEDDFLTTHHDLDYLYCDKERGGLFCDRRWQVGIVHKNRVVSDILVSIGRICL